jgi:ribosome-binding protein aMBF1 (putative translation factor)
MVVSMSMNTPTRSLSRLEVERRRRSWSQTELAAKVGLTAADISRYERGWARPYPRQAARLASVLGIPVDKLTEVVR